MVSTSRHHMKQKGNHSPRPRYHVSFQIDTIQSPEEYTAFLTRVQALFPFFDGKALDAGRFFFGNPDTEVYTFPGHRTLTDFIEELEENKFVADMEEASSTTQLGSIPEGSRNSTISHAAGKILKRWGDTPEAYEKFMDVVAQCSPPLPESEVSSTWKSAVRFFHEKVKKQPGYIPSETYNAPPEPQWEQPIPFTQHALPPFPVDAFPSAIRDYILAVAETTQTKVDMSATAALAVLALCQQGKFRIKGKDDWSEPLNLFAVIVAEPSERKSAVINFMTQPVSRYEAEYNKQHAAAIERSRTEKRILEKQQRNLEDLVLKGKAQMEDLQDISLQLAEFREKMPMRLYVDDVTTEKLTSVLAENNGTAAVVSAEGGIFDMLAGIYTKNIEQHKGRKMKEIFSGLHYAKEKTLIPNHLGPWGYDSTKDMVRKCEDELVLRYGSVDSIDSYKYLLDEIHEIYSLIDNGSPQISHDLRDQFEKYMLQILFSKLEELADFCEETDRYFENYGNEDVCPEGATKVTIIFGEEEFCEYAK